jgi:hypothetical protein
MVVIDVTSRGITATCDSCGVTVRKMTVNLLDLQHEDGCQGSNLFAFNSPERFTG